MIFYGVTASLFNKMIKIFKNREKYVDFIEFLTRI